MRPIPLILIAAPDGFHPGLVGVTSGEGYETLVVHSGESALRALYKHRPDLLILSLRLGGLSPWEVLSRVRDMSDLPIAVVDASFHVRDAVRALNSGADDYVTAEVPQALYEPMLRARLRRATGGAPEVMSLVEDGRLTLDLRAHEAVLDGQWLDLTPIEFALLTALARHSGQVLSADQLLHMVWDVPPGSDPARVKYTVLRLRRKIARTTGRPAPVETVRGLGYRYPAPGTSEAPEAPEGTSTGPLDPAGPPPAGP
ncbi:response regulator transcription factor [Streptomyces sp. NBC_01433]|uniref:response regulator transcription factor n=1 Tax=Streptomyces sp. NBC_01433 TaxID=2903864 RepID=UPI002252FFFF|nr:response regulator transcription factor [Streptomyces sp. NBC_01433]MCX4677290.1 response regulator transcription factor [Streptomyces sp. NBC_01433]